MVTPPEETWWWVLPRVSFSQHIHAGMSWWGSLMSWMSPVGGRWWWPSPCSQKMDMPGVSGKRQDMRVTEAQHLLPPILPPLGLKGFYSKYPAKGTGEQQAWGQPPAAPRHGGDEGRNWDQPPVPRKPSSSNGNSHKEGVTGILSPRC